MKRLLLVISFLAFAVLATRAGVAQDKVARAVTNETLEKILKGLDVKYQKVEPKDKDGASLYFDFVRNNQPCRLKNYGNDLWIETTTEKGLKLEDVNRWNADAKFSRLVLIEDKDKSIVSLEAQLDCLGGVTEATIKSYLNRFDAEAQKFAKFAK